MMITFLLFPSVSSFDAKKLWSGLKQKLGFGSNESTTTTAASETKSSITGDPRIQEFLSESEGNAEDTLFEVIKQDLAEIIKDEDRKNIRKPSLTYDKTSDHRFKVNNGKGGQHEIKMTNVDKEILNLVKNATTSSTTTMKTTTTMR